LTKQRDKLKALSAVMLHWAENNKRALLRGEYKVPEVWKKAFKYVTALDMKLYMKYATALTKAEMIWCNKYYKEYR
jgi:hypothetical protein